MLFFRLKGRKRKMKKRIFSIFSFFFLLEEKKKGLMQRKRRVFKKRKMSGKNSEKAGIYVPGCYPSFAFPLSLTKRTRTPFPHVRRVKDPPGPSSAFCSASFSSKRQFSLFTQDAGRRPPEREGNEK